MMLGSGSEPQLPDSDSHKDKQPIHLQPFCTYNHSVFHFQYSIQ